MKVKNIEDLAFMQTPENWPRRPILPVKRRRDRNWPECGLMVEGEANVYLAGLYNELVRKDQAGFLAGPKITYDSLQAAVADGWVVD